MKRHTEPLPELTEAERRLLHEQCLKCAEADRVYDLEVAAARKALTGVVA